MGHDYKHHARSCFMSFYLRSDLGDQFRVHVRWRLGLWWWQSTTDSPHSVSSGAEKKNNCTVCRFLSYWLLLCLYNPSHSLGTEEVPGNMGMLDQVHFVSLIFEEIVNRYETRLLRYVGFRRTLHLLEAIQPRWPTQRTATVPGWKNQMC